MAFQLGQYDYPIDQGALWIVLVVSLVFNVFLFSRGHGTYSIKYELMKQHRFFRVWQSCTMAVEILYKFFFALPFIIIGVIALLRGIRNPIQVLPILVNGLIVILIIYPSHRQAYFLKNGFIWIFAIASQIVTLLLSDANPDDPSSFIQISVIFYTANSMLFCLALLNNEKIYWQLSYGVEQCGEQIIKEVNEDWIINAIPKLPDVFDGGLYGWMSKKGTYTTFLLLYFFSLVVLGIYAFLIYELQGSMLGVTGLVTSIIYDIFILTCSGLKSNERSVSTLFIMVFAGRFLSFVFGTNYWLFGYCVLYFFVGIFIGKVLIDRHFPLKFQKPRQKLQKVNALKTPQFVLLILTGQIIVLILVEQLADVTQKVYINFNNKEVPVWQFAIVIVMLTWVVIMYLASARIISRHINKIRSLTYYYFGVTGITDYHIYIVLTYSLIIAVGLYSLLYLESKDIFLGCIFLPLAFIFVFEIGVAWVKNDFAILADTQQHNKKSFKKYMVKLDKLKVLNERRRIQNQKNRNGGQLESSSFGGTGMVMGNTTEKKLLQSNTPGLFNSINKNFFQKPSNENNQVAAPTTSKITVTGGGLQQQGQDSMHGLSYKQLERQQTYKQEKQPTIQDFQQLKDWRLFDDMNIKEIWNNLTSYDKTILLFAFLLVLMMVIYSVIAAVWADSISGIGFTVSIFSFLTSFVYYKSAKSGNPAGVDEIIIAWIGFLGGLIYWAVYYQNAIAGILWALVLILLYSLSLSSGIKKNIQIHMLAFMGVKIIISLGFICIVLGYAYSLTVSIVFMIIVIAIAQGLLNFYFLQKNGFIPTPLKIITGITLGCMILGIAIAGFLLDQVSDFVVFSVVMLLIFLGLIGVSGIIALSKQNGKYDNPHVYSSYGQPVYRFETGDQKLKSSMKHVFLFQGSTILLVVYATITTLFFKYKYLSIYVLSIFLILQFMDIIMRSMETYYFLGENRKYLTHQLIVQAFNKVKDKYMLNETEGQDSPYYIALFEETKKKAQQAISDDDKNDLWKQTVLLKEEVIKNLQEQEKFLFFWLALIRSFLYSAKRNMEIQFVSQIQEIQDQLKQKGILIESIHSAQPVNIKYKLIQKDLHALPPLDYIIYQEIHKAHKYQSHQKKKQLSKLHLKVQQESKKKQEELFQKFQEKAQIEQIADANKIDEFSQLIKSLGNGKFTDEEFPPNQTSLGTLSARVCSWRRPEMDEKFISGAGMSPDDVKQGQIGDCYLISSFAVLGQEFLKKSIGLEGEDGKLWVNEKGAYMVRFYKFLKEVYVIVDDNLPIDASDKWVFARSEQKGEYWPGILEKAYAKLYNGYQNIVSGKCHQVLSQFTGGFPFEILIAQYKSNPNGLWAKMISGKQHGYLISAGSPQHEQGDLAFSKRGIVQGHAYSILDVRAVEDNKLIKLKNPHGSEGIQWKGPFSDDSEEMKKRLRKLLDHSKKNDGIFWMALEDFILEFKSLYICCIFGEKWKKLDPIQGQWKSTNSFGRAENTTKANRNIQFGITVNKKCTLFVSLSQEHLTALKGKNYIQLRVQRNQNKRIQKTDVSSDRLCGTPTKPTNLVTISEEIILENSSYPYTFTLYISSQQEGKGAYGKFKLQMYCDDKDISVTGHQDFDKKTFNLE